MNPTLLANPLTATDITDITHSPKTNDEFLSAIFTGLTDSQRPFVLGFSGKPKERKAWAGGAWQFGKVGTENASQNWYFSLAVFEPATDGYHRREKDCVALLGVMLDDIGTKAKPLDRLSACPPSYIIETSEGNFQAGYLFDTPQTDLEAVTGLNQSLVEAELCDPGAKSPATRYGRLPFASNGKTTPAFECKLTEWHPERRYSIKQIIEQLELEPPKQKGRPTRKSGATQLEDGVYSPRLAENEVITALKQRGLYKSPLGSGKHDVTCPWVHEHTDQTDHGSAYFEPSDTFPVGGYKCQHGHGDIYKIGKLLTFLAVTFTAAKHKPTIKAEAGEIGRIADAAERELAATGRYYQRGGLIVSVASDPASKETTIRPVSQPALLRALAGVAVWTRFDSRSESDVVIDPPQKHVAVLADSEQYNHLAALAGIARQPHLRLDGSIVSEAGFDEMTGLFGVFDARQFNIPDKPSKAQAASALAELRTLLAEFSFANQHDEAAALAGILTAAIRQSLPLAPMIHIRAPQIASGKSYLSGIIAAFASPSSPSAVAFPTSDEECVKLLLATLLAAPGCVIFDNLTSDLIPFKSLCSALTEESLTGRILGVSKTATVGTRSLFLSSGNNVDAVKDMARRCITINIDPQVETPATRQFKSDPLASVRLDRAHFVSLALTVVRAWIMSDAEVLPCKPLASYGQWSSWVRQPLLWLGFPDPAERVFEQLAQDPDRETLGRLLHVWSKAFGNEPTMIRSASSAAVFNVELMETLREVAEERGLINNRRLGRWIARHAGRIVDGLRFERASGTTSAERWIAKSVMSVKAVSFPELPESVDEICEVEL
ncbi:MAG: hypothetical protein Q7U05_03845 [Polaromonas sp.]|nr:hypothetical protein [Polaromonas sp.]